MGLNVTAITDRELEECEGTFSTKFCYFLCGLDAHTNHEFGQLEKVLNCDLSVLKEMDLYHYSEEEEESWIQTEAESPADEERIKQEFSEGRAKAYQEISQVKAVLKKLLSKLTTSNRYYDKVEYNEPWIYDYFKGGKFEKDIEELLAFVVCAERKGAKRITFVMD